MCCVPQMPHLPQRESRCLPTRRFQHRLSGRTGEPASPELQRLHPKEQRQEDQSGRVAATKCSCSLHDVSSAGTQGPRGAAFVFDQHLLNLSPVRCTMGCSFFYIYIFSGILIYLKEQTTERGRRDGGRGREREPPISGSHPHVAATA